MKVTRKGKNIIVSGTFEKMRKLIEELRNYGIHLTHEDLYKALGFSEEDYKDWHPYDTDFSGACTGFSEFIEHHVKDCTNEREAKKRLEELRDRICQYLESILNSQICWEVEVE